MTTGIYRYQDRWESFLLASRSCLNPPGPLEKAKSLLYGTWICIEQTEKTSCIPYYAHMLIVVAFLVVNFFGFLIITRHHEGVERWYCSRMKATSLPDLPIPTRSLNSSNRPKLFRPNILYKTEKTQRLLAFERIRRGDFFYRLPYKVARWPADGRTDYQQPCACYRLTAPEVRLAFSRVGAGRSGSKMLRTFSHTLKR